MKLTAKTVGTVKVPAGKSEHIVYDEEVAGFGVRVRAGGARTFIYQYKIGKQNRRLTLGTAAKEAFPGIRQRVLDLQAQVRLGQDPAVAKEALKRQAAETFKGIADLYLAKQLKTSRPRTYAEEERYLLAVAKSLHSRPVATITRRDIAELLTATETGITRGKTGAATVNRLRSILSAMFAWAMRDGLVENNPVTGTNKRDESPRERSLVDPETGSIEELIQVWRALPDDNFGAAMKLLILTGQRRNEIGGLRWDELDDGLTRIRLPAQRTKNGREHLIPLSQAARDILTRVPRIVGQDTLFGSGKDGASNWGAWKAELDEKLPQLQPWVIHDLRRSTATGMAKLGVLPHVIEAILNHVSGHKAGVAGVYNLNTYLPEKTAALTIWAEHLMAAVSGKPAKVVPLRA